MLKHIILFATILCCSNALTVEMIESVELTGSTFDNFTHGKHIIFTFWSSYDSDSRMFKTSTWDMLSGEIKKIVRFDAPLVASMNCADARNSEFCFKWKPFNITKYPMIAYSYNNEPFKLYNESNGMGYPDISQFAHDYFERNCALNPKYCTPREYELVEGWKNLTLVGQVTAHMELKKNVDKKIREFEKFRLSLKQQFLQAQQDTQREIDMTDSDSMILLKLIEFAPAPDVRDAVHEAASSMTDGNSIVTAEEVNGTMVYAIQVTNETNATNATNATNTTTKDEL